MTNMYAIVLLPVIWIHFLLVTATILLPADHRPVRYIRIGIFAILTGAPALFLLLKAVFPLSFVVPALWIILILQRIFRFPWVSEFLYICSSMLCIVAIAGLATPSTTWGDGYKVIGLVFLPLSISLSTLIYHQIRWKPLFGVGKIIVGAMSIAAIIWVSITFPSRDYAADLDLEVTKVAVNTAVIQLVEGIVALGFLKIHIAPPDQCGLRMP